MDMSEPMVGSLGPADAYAVQSSTNPERAYLVVQFAGIVDDDYAMQDQWRCCCRAGLNGVPCRHIEAVKAMQAKEHTESLAPVRHLFPLKGGAA